MAEGACYYSDVPAVGAAVEMLGALSLVEPRGSASLHCPGIEKDGWQRPRSYWHKLPGTAQASSVPPGAASSPPNSPLIAPEPTVDA